MVSRMITTGCLLFLCLSTIIPLEVTAGPLEPSGEDLRHRPQMFSGMMPLYSSYSLFPVLRQEHNSLIEIENPLKKSPIQRQIPNPIAELIMLIPFLPIQINVPDTASAISSGIQGILGAIGQRLPFFNRFVPMVMNSPQSGTAEQMAQMTEMTQNPELRNAFYAGPASPEVPMIFLVPFSAGSRQSRDMNEIMINSEPNPPPAKAEKMDPAP